MEEPTFEGIEVAVAGTRGELHLNRPEKLNPLSQDTLRDLAEAARWFNSNPDLKVVVVAGRGRAFSSGADVTAFAGSTAKDAWNRRRDADAGRVMADALEEMTAVTIAKIHGHCIGGGVVLGRRLRPAARSRGHQLLDSRGRPRDPAGLGRHPAPGSRHRPGADQGAGDDLPAVRRCRGARRRRSSTGSSPPISSTVRSRSWRRCSRASRSWRCSRPSATPTRSPRRWSARCAAGPTPTACSPGSATPRATRPRPATWRGSAAARTPRAPRVSLGDEPAMLITIRTRPTTPIPWRRALTPLAASS